MTLDRRDIDTRICEHRECTAGCAREAFRVHGTRGSLEHDSWCTREGRESLSVDNMRDPLQPEVAKAFRRMTGTETAPRDDFVASGHGGSHPHLVHEFVDAVAHDRIPAINVWEAARYTAAGVMAHQSCLRDGELLDVPDWGDAPGVFGVQGDGQRGLCRQSTAEAVSRCRSADRRPADADCYGWPRLSWVG